MKKLLVATLLTTAGCSLVAWAQTVRRDGRWEVKTEMSMPGMTMNMPATTTTQCITQAEADDPQKQMPPEGRGMPSGCKVSDFKVDGNKVTYNVTCTSPQPATMAAEMVYGVDKYDGTMTMQMSRGGQPMTMVMKYTGKRLGDCVK
jgi:hypothetical protein